MYNLIWDQISKTFGNEIAILISLSGYILFLFLFYSPKNNYIWKDFQWGDRLLLGVIIGFIFWILFIFPCTLILGQIMLLIPKNILTLYSLNVFFSIPQQAITTCLLFIVILNIRRNNIIFSRYGAMNVIGFIQYQLPKYIYFIIYFITLQIFSYYVAIIDYKNYLSIINFWLLELSINVLWFPFLLVGFMLISLILFHYDMLHDVNMRSYFTVFNRSIVHGRKIFNIKSWIIISILFNLVIVETFSALDDKYTLIIPSYESVDYDIWGNVVLQKKPNSDNYFFISHGEETIMIKNAYFNHTQYLIMPTPENSSDIKCYDESIELSEIHDGEFLNIRLEREYKRWDVFNITLSFEKEVDEDIYIYETIGERQSLGNGTNQLSFTLMIINNSTLSIDSRSDYAALNLYPFISRNITVKCYENGVLKKVEDFDYTIRYDWFYPTIYVGPHSKKIITFIVKGIT